MNIFLLQDGTNMTTEKISLLQLLEDSVVQAIQIGVVQLHRPYPIKLDVFDDGKPVQLVVEPKLWPLWLNRNYPGQEVRAYPSGLLVGPARGHVQVLWKWSEHEVAATILYSWKDNGGKPGFWDFKIDQSVVVPTWRYHSIDLTEDPDRNKFRNTLEWGEAYFEQVQQG